MSDVVVRVDDLWKRYGHPLGHTVAQAQSRLRGRRWAQADDENWALRGVSFELKRGDSIGMIGRNGAGKSTLLKVLAGVTPPTRGRVEVTGRLFPMIELNAGVHPDLTGRENIDVLGAIMGLSRREIRAKMDGIVDFAELGDAVDTPVRTYSSGMMSRLGFAVAINVDADILLIDEVLSVGDIAFQKKCLAAIDDARHRGTAVIFVSHSPYQVERTCNHAIMLERGQVIEAGKPSEILHHYFAGFVKAGSADAVDLSAADDRPGTGELRLTSVEFLGPDGKPAAEVATSGGVTFRFHYEAEREIAMPNIGLRLIDSYNSIVAAIDFTRFREQRPIGRRGHFDCAMERFPLVAGNYTLSAAVKGLALLDEVVGVPVEVVSGASVLIDTAMMGTVHIPAHWTHSDVAPVEVA